MRTLQDLIAEWTAAADAGTLLTEKHDPNRPNDQRFHTKVSHEVSASPGTFLRSGAYDVYEYRTAGHANECWVLAPSSGAFSGSLATAFCGATALSGTYDRLLFASGTNQPVHVMGETSAALTAPRFTFVRKVT